MREKSHGSIIVSGRGKEITGRSINSKVTIFCTGKENNAKRDDPTQRRNRNFYQLIIAIIHRINNANSCYDTTAAVSVSGP